MQGVALLLLLLAVPAAVAKEPAVNCSDLSSMPLLAITGIDDSARNYELREACMRERRDCTFLPNVDTVTLGRTQLNKASHEARKSQVSSNRWSPVILDRKWTESELACSLAHRAAYDYIQLNQLQCAIVLEGDATLARGFSSFARGLALPPSWDLIMLTADTYGRTSQDEALARTQPRVLGGLSLWGSIAYAVTLRSARQLRAAQTPVVTVSDALFRSVDPRWNKNAATPFLTYHLRPGLAWTSASGLKNSTIQHTKHLTGWRR